MPSVLVELGFITNDIESDKLKDTVWQEKAINALSKSVIEYRHYSEKHEK